MNEVLTKDNIKVYDHFEMPNEQFLCWLVFEKGISFNRIFPIQISFAK